MNNILVGPNMAGKSNLIDCIKFLGQMVQFGLSKTFLDRNGFPEVVWKGSDEHRITLQLSAKGIENKTYDYTIGVDLKLMGFERCRVGRPSGIRHETLSKKHAIREVTHAPGYHACSYRTHQFCQIAGFARSS
jgi:predicted ATPase